MRADRLLSILLLLQNRGQLTSRELAARLEVSERTIHRDMEALSAAGVPVYAERGAGGGWRLPDGYRTTLTGLSLPELQSLLLATPTLVQDLGLSSSFPVALQKLVASSPSSLQRDLNLLLERIHVDGAGWHQSTESYPFLPTVQAAVWQERRLLIRYQREAQVVERTVEPLGLVAKRGVWYMVAQVEGDRRTYRLSRLVGAELLAERFARPTDFVLEAFWEESTRAFRSKLPRYPATVRVRVQALERLSRERYVRLLGSQPNGQDWVVDVEFHTLESACWQILSYAREMEALAPAELRAAVAAELEATLALYRTGPGLPPRGA